MVRDRPGRVFAIGEGLLPKETYIKQGALWDEKARAYWAHMGFFEPDRPHEVHADAGGYQGPGAAGAAAESGFRVYYPALAGPKGPALQRDPEPPLILAGRAGRAGTPEPSRVFATWDEFTPGGSRRQGAPGAPRIAVSFYKATYYSDETELLDAVVAEIERQGAEAIPMFGYPGAIAAERLLIDPSGKPRADVMLGFNFNFAAPDSSTIWRRSMCRSSI